MTQLEFLQILAAQRTAPWLGANADERVANLTARVEAQRPTKRTLSAWITDLKDQPYDLPAGAPEPTAATGAPVVGPGVYELAGEVFIVKMNKAKTRRYAMKLVEIGGDRLTEAGTVVNIDYTYAPGAVLRLLPEHQMTLERAKELTVRYGRCLNPSCRRRLTAAKSVEQGMGPVCIKMFARPTAPAAAAEPVPALAG